MRLGVMVHILNPSAQEKQVDFCELKITLVYIVSSR